jgi:hypothetical protein
LLRTLGIGVNMTGCARAPSPAFGDYSRDEVFERDLDEPLSDRGTHLMDGPVCFDKLDPDHSHSAITRQMALDAVRCPAIPEPTYDQQLWV